MITIGAHEELDEEIQEYKTEEMTNQELRQELEEAQEDLTAWGEDWYHQEHLPLHQPRDRVDPFAETNALMESFNQPGDSEAVAAKKALPLPAPLTPAVLQTSALSSRHFLLLLCPSLRARFLRRPRNKNRKRELLKQTLPNRSGNPTETLNSKKPTSRSDFLSNTRRRLRPCASTRERSQQTIPSQPTPLLAAVSTGVPSVAPVSGVASTHGAALPAMMVPNPSTPLGAFPTQTPLPAHPQLHADEYFKGEKSPLPKLVIKGGDATSVTRTVHEWLQKTAMALNTWSSSAIQLWHHAVSLAKGAHLQWTLMAPNQRALQTIKVAIHLVTLCPHDFQSWKPRCEGRPH